MSGWAEAVEASKPQPAPPKVRKTVPERLDEIVDSLASGPQSWPRITKWWRDKIGAWYAGGQRTAYFRVGRRGTKSSTMCLLAVCEALYGDHELPADGPGVVAIVSENLTQAKDRIVSIGKILDRLGIPHSQNTQTIKLEDRAIEFRAYACSIGAVAGFAAIFIILDEVAKWRNEKGTANPAYEVIGGIMPTMATMPNAKCVLISSALGTMDAHAKGVERGTNEHQYVECATTWEAFPNIGGAETEEEAIAITRGLEPNEAIWKREYASIPLEGDEESFFSAELLSRHTRPSGDLPAETGTTYVAAMDPAFVKNAWTLCIAAQRYVVDEGRARLKRSIVLVNEWRGTAKDPLNPEDILREIAGILKPYRLDQVWSDQYEQFSLHAIGNRKDVNLSIAIVDGGAQAKLTRYDELSTMLHDGEIELHPDKQLRADLLSIRRTLTPNGFTIGLLETGDGRHSDYAPSAVVALTKALEAPALTPDQRRAISPPEIKPGYGTVAAWEAEEAALLASMEREAGQEAGEFWEKLVSDEAEDMFGG